MDRQLSFEASLFGDEQRWSVHMGIDTDPATDPMGDRFQWLTLSAGYTPDRSWIPDWRIGYRPNLVGTKLGYIGVGVTAFRFINFDLASSLDTVTISGRKLPQGLMASLGFEITW